MHYIFNTEQGAKDYNTQVCKASNFVQGVQWGIPRKHPSKELWAIKASDRVVLKNQDKQNLTDDWFPSIDA